MSPRSSIVTVITVAATDAAMDAGCAVLFYVLRTPDTAARAVGVARRLDVASAVA